jgi:hypothetical protein
MISHILFDNNGVLTTSDGEKTHQAVADYLKIDRSDVNALFAPDVRALDTGARGHDKKTILSALHSNS